MCGSQYHCFRFSTGSLSIEVKVNVFVLNEMGCL